MGSPSRTFSMNLPKNTYSDFAADYFNEIANSLKDGF